MCAGGGLKFANGWYGAGGAGGQEEAEGVDCLALPSSRMGAVNGCHRSLSAAHCQLRVGQRPPDGFMLHAICSTLSAARHLLHAICCTLIVVRWCLCLAPR